MKVLISGVLVLVLAACGGGESAADRQATADEAFARTCAAVRNGVDAFNSGDFSGTPIFFRDAIGDAQQYAEASAEQSADDLLEAVKYYADLSADDYPTASVSSPDFAKYKAITLGQCAPDGNTTTA